jgi:gliding motility-associated-like protein
VPNLATIAPVLNATSPNGINGTWSPAIINTTVGSSYVFTPNSGQCATIFTSTVIITSPNIVPNFNPISPICVGDTLLALPTTSTNGITGSWSPALDNTQTKIYTFTPDAGQCAVATQITITVNTPSLVATFLTSTVTICNGDALTALPTMSTNGINGSWSPVLNNTQTQTYTFLPNPGQCALGNTFIINVTQKTIPTFNPVNPVCPGGILNALPITSLNGITGTWSPAINNMQTQTYTFQPDPNQCATTANLTITIIQPILPVFNPIAPVCYGTAINPLPSISSNGITGTWSPAFDNTTSQLYTFIPNAPQCATTSDLTITVAPNPTFTNTAYICFDAAGQLVNPANIDSGLSSAEYSFVWIKDGDVNPLGNVSPSYQATQTGIYKVTATNLITNCTITLVTTVEASPEATAYAYVNEDFADVQQIIVNVNGGLGDFLYQLNYGPFQQSNIFTITKGGDYTIHVKDLSGCNTFELQVTAFNFPKFFTPNDDGYNDTWNVDGLQAGQQGLITIFDRYGKLLKQITAHGEGWNGTFNGNRLPSTDYWFVISYRSISGESRTFRSHFSLKR